VTEAASRPAFPRKDAHGRIAVLADLLGLVAAGLVGSAVVLMVFDALLSLLGSGKFGQLSGWLAVVLPVMLLVEEFRAWTGWRRTLVAAVSLLLAGGAGMLLAGLLSWPPLATGALGATVTVLGYATLWFFGIRLAESSAAVPAGRKQP